MTDALTAFGQALARHNIAIDSLRRMPAGCSLRYEHRDARQAKDIALVALLYAKAPGICEHLLSVTPIETDGDDDERVANFFVTRQLAEQYADGDIERSAYIQTVRDTWSYMRPDGEGGRR